MSTTLRSLAEMVQGQIGGDGDLVIHAARSLGEAQPGDITFVESEKHAHHLASCRASAVVVPTQLPVEGRTVVRVADPLGAFVTIVRHLQGRKDPAPHGIDPLASVHPTVRVGAEPSIFPLAAIGEGTVIGARCKIHSGAVIGRHCWIGDDAVIYANAVLYDGTVLGNRVIVHSAAILGADGFGFRLQNGRHVKVPQLGHVEIGDDVEIGACTAIDRGTFQATRIGAGTKIDNLVQIGHNCSLGKHNLIISQVGIAGSSGTGDYVVMAGQVGVADHVHVGDRVMVGAKSGVTKDVPAGERVLGTPARSEREQKRVMMSLDKLPEIRRDVRRLKQHLGLKDEDE